MKFNRKKPQKPVMSYNAAGGRSFVETPELELAGLVLTTFMDDQFYRSQNGVINRLRALVAQVDPNFTGRLAIFARHIFGMRSVTHVLVGELLANRIHGNVDKWITAVVKRPDDMTEILAYWGYTYGKPIPNALKRGLARAFDKFDEYSLGKYRSENSEVKLIDVVNLVHPRPTDKNRDALRKLVKGELRSFDTWEVELSEAGKTGERPATVWARILPKMGLFALLRNLRNIEQTGDIGLMAAAAEQLVDREAIKRSLILPFRFATAYEHVNNGILRGAVEAAADLALDNIPQWNGRTAVILDVSGSMQGKPAEVGSLFAAALIRRNNGHLITFSTGAQMHHLSNRAASILAIAGEVRSKFNWGGTDFNAPFYVMGATPYDRLVFLSDMQGWIGGDAPLVSFNNYKQLIGATPRVYSFNLNDYGSLMFPQANITCIAGWSEKVFDLIQLLEDNNTPLTTVIKKTELDGKVHL